MDAEKIQVGRVRGVVAHYYRDHKGAVHVQSADAEYTFCGFAWDVCSDMDDAPRDAEAMTFHDGPATCQNCKDAINGTKQAMVGVRFSKTLQNSN